MTTIGALGDVAIAREAPRKRGKLQGRGAASVPARSGARNDGTHVLASHGSTAISVGAEAARASESASTVSPDPPMCRGALSFAANQVRVSVIRAARRGAAWCWRPAGSLVILPVHWNSEDPREEPGSWPVVFVLCPAGGGTRSVGDQATNERVLVRSQLRDQLIVDCRPRAFNLEVVAVDRDVNVSACELLEQGVERRRAHTVTDTRRSSVAPVWRRRLAFRRASSSSALRTPSGPRCTSPHLGQVRKSPLRVRLRKL